MTEESEKIVERVQSASFSIETRPSTVNFRYEVGDNKINVEVRGSRSRRLYGDDKDFHDDNLHAIEAIWGTLGKGVNFLRRKQELEGKKIVASLEPNFLFYLVYPGEAIIDINTIEGDYERCQTPWKIVEETKPVPWHEKPGSKQTATYTCQCDDEIDVVF